MNPPDAPPDAPLPDADDERDRAWAARLHDRTGEVELLISGAVLFGLLQIPGHLDAWFDALRLRLPGGYYDAAFVGWYYAKLIVYTLIGSFFLHVFARAYWVGLLGLDSVFPRGVQWDEVRYGPIAKEEYRRRHRPLASLARRADDFGSAVFSMGFWIVLLFVISVGMAALTGGIALVLHQWIFPGASVGRTWVVVTLGLSLFPALVLNVDRLAGGRLSPDGRMAWLVRKVVGAFHFSFAGQLLVSIQFTLFSNLRRRVMWLLLGGILGLLVGGFIAGEKIRRGDWILSPSAVFPARPGAAAADGIYYESTPGRRVSAVPTIQSDVVTGPYLRLRVPFVASREGDRLQEVCPHLPVQGRAGLVATSPTDPPPDPAVEARVLGCLARLWRVRLDGAAVAPDWVFDAGADAGIRGIVAYLPTRELAPGPHLLEVSEMPPPSDAKAKAADPGKSGIRRHLIRFWI